jgi:hypothetical protein
MLVRIQQGQLNVANSANNCDKILFCNFEQCFIFAPQGGAAVARWAHNSEVVGSIPIPATIFYQQPV